MGTPYEGGLFSVDIQLGDSYPFEPPKMVFITKVWHPNVSSANGAICLDILKVRSAIPRSTRRVCRARGSGQCARAGANEGHADPTPTAHALHSRPRAHSLPLAGRARLQDQWSPALTLKTALLSLQALLSTPEPNDPQDAQVASQYIKNYEEYKNTARYWTETFAVPSSDDAKVARLCEMGFDTESVKAALAATGGDESAALEKLCGA